MMKHLKILSLLFLLSFSGNVNAKPVPPGAGGGVTLPLIYYF